MTQNGIKINNILIDEEIFREEIVEYTLRERKEMIDSLISWISEAKETDKFMMKEDLKELLSLDCQYIFSSVSTNEYINPNENEWNEICEDIIEENKKLKEVKE